MLQSKLVVAEQRRGETTAAVVATNASGEIVSGVGLPMVSVASAAPLLPLSKDALGWGG